MAEAPREVQVRIKVDMDQVAASLRAMNAAVEKFRLAMSRPVRWHPKSWYAMTRGADDERGQ
jgi:hypothetical protein